MRIHSRIVRVGPLVVLLSLVQAGCGLIGPSCNDEDGAVLDARGDVAPGSTVSHTVVSPKNSNLVMRLQWPETAVTLGLRATIIACGGHTGCQMTTVTPPFGPGGSSPTPQPWPPGLRELQVDGSQGKTWRIDVTNESDRDARYTLQVSYKIRCER
jgi:hypothetical protein